MSRGPLRPWWLLLLLPASCLTYNRVRIDEPVREEGLSALRPGESTLQDSLALLGAPNRAFEAPGEGMALLWVWQDADHFGLSISPSTGTWTDVLQFTLDLSDATLPGCMLWFDSEARLERWRRGRLGELLPRRTRPATPDA